MKYGKELVDRLKKELNEIDSQIDKLQEEITKTDGKAKELENDFSIEAVNKQRDLLGTRNVYEKALKRAKQHRTELIDGRTDETLAKCVKVFEQAEQETQKKVDKLNQSIETKVNEIAELYQQTRTIDEDTKAELDELIELVTPYVSDKPDSRYVYMGESEPAIELLKRRTRNQKDVGNRLYMVTGFNEYERGIKGLNNLK